jgi:hypothetical protein
MRHAFKIVLAVSDRCYYNAFKIALGVRNMRLNRFKHRCNSSDTFVDTISEDVIGNGR